MTLDSRLAGLDLNRASPVPARTSARSATAVPVAASESDGRKTESAAATQPG
jgi:hypothetical protein